MISNIRKNCMGTISFSGKFKGMRKAQDFIVYPINKETEQLQIQSDGRAGFICVKTGEVRLSGSNDQYGFHNAKPLETLDIYEHNHLITAIHSTANKNAGTNGIMYCDNSAAGAI